MIFFFGYCDRNIADGFIQAFNEWKNSYTMYMNYDEKLLIIWSKQYYSAVW